MNRNDNYALTMTTFTVTNEKLYGNYKGTYPHIVKIIWQAGELNSSILERFTHLEELVCKGNDLVSLGAIQNLTSLRILNCAGNNLISLQGIQNLTGLRFLDCSNNRLESLVELRNLRLRELYCGFDAITSLDGIQNSTDLTVLDCTSNQVSSLAEIRNCQNLRQLLCRKNKLTSIQIIQFFPKLTKLICSENLIQTIAVPRVSPTVTELECSCCGLHTLEGISAYVGLKVLYCGCNNLKSLAGIEGCINLERFRCSINDLTGLRELSGLRQLHYLRCTYNYIESLDGIQNCTLLRELDCSGNALRSIDPVATLTNIETIACDSNKIASLEPVINLKKLNYFRYELNPLKVQSEQYQKFIDAYNSMYAPRSCRQTSTRRKTTVYDNTQNAHDIHIQQSICKSLSSLLADPDPRLTSDDLQAMIASVDLSDEVKRLLTKYCADKSRHSVHKISYEKLLSYVWNRITGSEHTTELFKILSQQILDSENKCFTGRFNRLVSVLAGFFPDIVIEISDTSRISAIIITIRERISPYNPVTHAKIATTELQQAGYSLDVIKPWIDAIHDSQ